MDAGRLAQLEEDTKERLRKLKEAAAVRAGAGSSVPDGRLETQELSASSQSAIERQRALQEVIEKRKRARELAVPTNDNAVKLKLREYAEPIVIFGEQVPDRRERLREIMAKHLNLDTPYEAPRGGDLATQAKRPAFAAPGDDQQLLEERRTEVFYTEGSEELKEARVWISRDSLARAERRLEAERERVRAECANVGADDLRHARLSTRLKGVQNQLSNFGDDRPISFVSFAPGSQVVATGSWSATVKLWSVPECKPLATLKGHSERISGLAWHPGACGSQSPTSVNLLSASCDSTAKLWPLEGGKPLGELSGHVGRLSRCAFHPSGRFAATASFDTSWRLWDVETCKELLLQEGHARALYAIAFHPDGSLVATAGLDACVRLWDVRSGRAIQAFQGHVKQVGARYFPDPPARPLAALVADRILPPPDPPRRSAHAGAWPRLLADGHAARFGRRRPLGALVGLA